MRPRVSVLMPTYEQSRFIARAIESLCHQTWSCWELIIVDDASPDDTASVVQPYLDDSRITYHRLDTNAGMAAALNFGLQQSNASFVAYLPSDDVYYPQHLASLLQLLEDNADAVLAFSGVRHHYNRNAAGEIDGDGLQLVQVVHRRLNECWTERAELVSDDLDRLFWHTLRPYGPFLGTGQVTCEWVAHLHQRHKLLREPEGGINTYRRHFNVPHPLRFHSTAGNFIDEVSLYRRFREREDTPMAPDGLKIVLAGELAYNAERVLALEEQGHRLYGLWMRDPYWYNTVGPLPFGHVTDIPLHDWRATLRRIRPDVIYAQLNWQAVPFIWELTETGIDVPLVWHFKEGPFICMEKGTWHKLVDIYHRADGHIFCNEENQEWYGLAMPGVGHSRPTMLLDGDLPKREWFEAPPAPRLSSRRDGIHTVVPGRPIGLHPHTVADLAAHDIHLHFYGDFTQKQWVDWIAKTQPMAPDHLHLHAQVNAPSWVEEFSQYDAGWLHWIKSENHGDLRRANWDDLNYPARMTTLVCAGLPLLQYDNSGARVATQTLGRQRAISVFFKDVAELSARLRDELRMAQLRQNVWTQRPQFTFDYHAGRLVEFFRKVIV